MSIAGGFTITTPRPGILKLSRLAGDPSQGQLFDDLAALGRPDSGTRWWPDSVQAFHSGGGMGAHVRRLSCSYRREVIAPPAAELGRTQEPPRRTPGVVEEGGEEEDEDGDAGEEEEEEDEQVVEAAVPGGPGGPGGPAVTVQVGPEEAITRVAGTLQPTWTGADTICTLEFTVDRRAPVNARMPGRDVHVPPRPARPPLQPREPSGGSFSFRAPPGFGVCGLWGRGTTGRMDALGVYYACCLPAWTPETHRLYPNAFKQTARLVCYGAQQYFRENQANMPQPLVHMIMAELARICYFEFEGAEAAGWGGDVTRLVVQRATVERSRR